MVTAEFMIMLSQLLTHVTAIDRGTTHIHAATGELTWLVQKGVFIVYASYYMISVYALPMSIDIVLYPCDLGVVRRRVSYVYYTCN